MKESIFFQKNNKADFKLESFELDISENKFKKVEIFDDILEGSGRLSKVVLNVGYITIHKEF